MKFSLSKIKWVGRSFEGSQYVALRESIFFYYFVVDVIPFNIFVGCSSLNYRFGYLCIDA